LNKATVSSLVAELARRGLVAAGDMERPGSVGRPGLTVHLDGRGICGVGVELNVDYAATLVLNLRGDVLFEKRVALDVPTLDAARTLDELAGLIAVAIAEVDARGVAPVGITVAIAGLTRTSDGVVTLAPNLGWRDVHVAEGLRARLDGRELPIRVENEANMAAVAEWAMGSEARTPDLVYLTGEVGVGGGVIVAGQLLRGAGGLAGEVGHMSLGSPDHVCGCGRRGCWETVVGLSALLRVAAEVDDPVRDTTRDLETRLSEIDRRAEAGDQRTLAALSQIGTELGIGASILINVFDPAVIVLGGFFAVLGRYLTGSMTAELESRVFGPGKARARVVLSTLGFTAAVRGGALVALESVFEDPTIVSAWDEAPGPRQQGASA
jgi:predicted NBD/HSP70 family sugar kinase